MKALALRNVCRGIGGAIIEATLLEELPWPWLVEVQQVLLALEVFEATMFRVVVDDRRGNKPIV
jgi:hypothetical protein